MVVENKTLLSIEMERRGASSTLIGLNTGAGGRWAYKQWTKDNQQKFVRLCVEAGLGCATAEPASARAKAAARNLKAFANNEFPEPGRFRNDWAPAGAVQG